MMFKLPPTSSRETVVLGPAIVLRGPPLRLQLALLLQTVQRGKERPWIDVELIVTEDRKPLRDAVPVHRLTRVEREYCQNKRNFGDVLLLYGRPFWGPVIHQLPVVPTTYGLNEED